MEKYEVENTNNSKIIPKYNTILEKYNSALQTIDDVILKNYISNLENLDIIPLRKDTIADNLSENVRFFKINEMVYEKNENSTHKFASVFSALSNISCSIFTIIDSDGIKTDFYMGVRCTDENRTTSSVKNILENTLMGQFSGSKTQDYTLEEMQAVLENIREANISSVSCVANSKEENLSKNEEFVQGLEKLVYSMQGQKYTGIIIANTASQKQIHSLRREYEHIYTSLSPFASTQLNYSNNIAFGKNESTSDGTSENKTSSTSISKTESITNTNTSTHSISSEDPTTKLIKGVGGVASAVSSIASNIALITGNVPLAGSISMIGGLVSTGTQMLAGFTSKTETDSDSYSRSDGSSDTYGTSESNTEGTSHTHTQGTSINEGLSNAITMTSHDKTIENILSRIDRQLKRLDEFESLGMYSCATYFLSMDQAIAEMAAQTYKSIVGGENTGLEVSSINSWNLYNKEKTKEIANYVKNFMHPIFKYNRGFEDIELTPASIVSVKELAIHMGLPRKSVCGLPIIEHTDFGREIVKYDGLVDESGIKLGKIFSMGRVYPNMVCLDKKSLSMHTFVTGSTGSGKSNTIYEIIRQSRYNGIKFLIIEPVKGEYKHIFGSNPDVNVFGTNPKCSALIKINPFKFSDGIHVLEHIDRLIEIFNVCWPMYAAMPAILKEAILRAYENCGWNFVNSENRYDENIYPTFKDVEEELVEVVNSSEYSEELKGNYKGSLLTRIKSLTNGINGQIFNSNEIASEILFDENVIVDLSRVGSSETKSLIMGILIMRLGEYRMSKAGGMNIPFKHMTILEEAHNILKRTSTEQSQESSNPIGKSVELLSNAIAEMRTYGEGFVIVDQSPNAVDISAIRNTNTKIIMRLPNGEDRILAGKSVGIKDEQIDEIAKLTRGVAVVYQNDWVEPVLCQIQKFKGQESEYKYAGLLEFDLDMKKFKSDLVKFLLRTRVDEYIDVDIDKLEKDIYKADISTRNKLYLVDLVNEYKQKKYLSIWKEDKFSDLASIISGVLESNTWLKYVLERETDYDILTEKLKVNIENQVGELPYEYFISVAQCIMRDGISRKEWFGEIYDPWLTDLRKKVKL